MGLSPSVQAQDQAGVYLQSIDQLLHQAHMASQNAEQAASVQELKIYTDNVFETIWGTPSGLISNTGAVLAHGWKTRWQTDGTEFDEAHVGAMVRISPQFRSGKAWHHGTRTCHCKDARNP